MKYKFFFTGKPLKGCTHGPRPETLRWWQVRPWLLSLGKWRNWTEADGWYTNAGRRLWLYTRWGAFHFDVYWRV